MSFEFFKNLFNSPRFWAIVLAAVSVYLKTKGWIGDAETTLIATIAGGFTIVRTIDRISDKKVESAQIIADSSADTNKIQ